MKKNNLDVSNTAIPNVLLSDDWQKAYKKCDFTLVHIGDFSTLPILVVEQTQQELPLDAFMRVLQMLMMNANRKIKYLFSDVLLVMTKESQTALADALWDIFMTINKKVSPADKKWLIQAVGILYHADLDERVWQLIRDKKKKSIPLPYIRYAINILSEQAVYGYTLRKTDDFAVTNALQMLLKIQTHTSAGAQIRNMADKQLEYFAKSVDKDIQHIADYAIPTLAMDNHGKSHFDFGKRQFTMLLDIENNHIFIDNNGKSFKNLPKAKATDDLIKANQAHEKFKQVKKSLKYFTSHLKRIEELLDTPRYMSTEHFQQYYIRNIFMLHITKSLIWGIFDNSNGYKLLTPFRVVETGETVDMHDDEFELDEQALIMLLHPALLNTEQRNNILENISDDEIIQSFEQLGKPFNSLTADERRDFTIYRFQDKGFSCGALYYRKPWTIIYDDNEEYCLGFKRMVNGVEWSFYFKTAIPKNIHSEDAYQTHEIQPIKLSDKMNEADISQFIDYIERVLV